MRIRHGLLAACAAMTVAGAAAPAAADTTSDLLLRLKEKGILSDEEYEALLNRRTAETAAAPAAAGTDIDATVGAAKPAQAAAAAALDRNTLVRMGKNGGMDFGGVNLKVSGSVNGFYTYENGETPGPTTTVAGGVTTVGSKSTSSIRNGLLPGFIKFDLTTNQLGIDVGAHFGLYPGINSVNPVVFNANSPGQPTALTTSGIDARQTYLTFGTPKFGEIKIGRDIGLFGSEAILNDITLLGVGSTGGNAGPSNTSLGRIGVGYIYTDFQPQITYSSPKLGGLQLSVGAFQPLTTIGQSETNGSPGFQAEATFDYTADKLGVHAWISGLTQKHEGVAGLPDYTGSAIDAGAKLTFGPAGLVGYYYTGKGVGTTGLFLLSTDGLGRKRKSDGFYVQGTLGFGKVTLAASYGESRLDLTRGEVNPTLLDTNSSYVGQVRYGLTPWITLLSEYTHTKSEAHGGNQAESDGIAAGAILFF